MAEPKKTAPKEKPELSPEQAEIERLRGELETERQEYEAAKEAFKKAQVQGPGAQGHGVKLAPNQMQLNMIKKLWLNGGSPSGISQITRVAIEAVMAHCESFIKQGLKQTPGQVDVAQAGGAQKGPVPGGE